MLTVILEPLLIVKFSLLGLGNTSSKMPGKLEAVFIRAPIIRSSNGSVKVLALYAGDPVLVEDGPHLVATFHPELTADPRVHTLFLEKL